MALCDLFYLVKLAPRKKRGDGGGGIDKGALGGGIDLYLTAEDDGVALRILYIKRADALLYRGGEADIPLDLGRILARCQNHVGHLGI